jgi:hypothetical protein
MLEPNMDRWHQFAMSDPSNLSGESVHAFMKQILEYVDIDHIFVSDLDGAYEGLKGRSGTSLSVVEFMALVRQARQYDWAFFFLYVRRSLPGCHVANDDKSAMESADITVRLADDTYFYVYTKMEEFASLFRISNPEAEHKTLEFSSLEIMY